MLKRIFCLSLVLSAPLLFGQLDSNSVTVSASQSVNLQPDQVLFGLSLTTSLNATLDDVLAALKGSGITIANFFRTRKWFRISAECHQWKSATGHAHPMEFFACRPARSIEGNRHHAPKPSAEPGASQYRIHAGVHIAGDASLRQPAAIANLQHPRPDCRRHRTSAETCVSSRNESRFDTGHVQHYSEPVVQAYSAFLIGSVAFGATPQNCGLTVKFALTRF